jgi:hypothetical protein
VFFSHINSAPATSYLTASSIFLSQQISTSHQPAEQGAVGNQKTFNAVLVHYMLIHYFFLAFQMRGNGVHCFFTQDSELVLSIILLILVESRRPVCLPCCWDI